MGESQGNQTAKPSEDVIAHAKKVHQDWKYRYKYENLCPPDNCHKCGKHYWAQGEEPLSWSCICCGNIAYFTLGRFHQQIDAVIRSNRNEDYVLSEEGHAVLPKKNNDIKKINFNKKRKKK